MQIKMPNAFAAISRLERDILVAGSLTASKSTYHRDILFEGNSKNTFQTHTSCLRRNDNPSHNFPISQFMKHRGGIFNAVLLKTLLD